MLLDPKTPTTVNGLKGGTSQLSRGHQASLQETHRRALCMYSAAEEIKADVDA